MSAGVHPGLIVECCTTDSTDVARHYDELDRHYRELWGEHVHHGLWAHGTEDAEQAVHGLVAFVAERAQVTRGTSVCDLGCGYGATSRYLARDLGAEVTAITLSPAQHAFAVSQARAGDRVRLLLGDWLHNGLPDRAFDAVIAIESLEHIADRDRCLDEVGRVLRPGGRFVACVWLAAPHAGAWQRRHLLEPICREGRLSALADRATHERWLAARGFVLERFEDLTDRVKHTWTICIRRLAERLARDPSYRRYLLDRGARERVFAKTLCRMWLAYETGALRYGVFTAVRPGTSER